MKGLPTQLDIPEGYFPPPGSCRIWFPHRPAGQQPPPGDCEELVYEVPAGAWLLRRPVEEREHIQVIEYHPNQPTVEIAVRVYAVATGQFVRDVKPPPPERKTGPGENRAPSAPNEKPTDAADDPKKSPLKQRHSG